MGTLDYIVIALFAIAMIGIVVWVFKQKQKSSGDFFLAGRDATWLAIGASIFASNIGSEHLIGLAGAGASSGMAMAHWEIQGWMILILGWVFVPFYSRSMVLTMPEFLERRYNKESRTILSVISLVSYVLTKVAVTVYAGGLVFKEVFGIQELWGIDFFWIAAIGLVLLTALYTVIGGMKSVLYTSVLQTPILLIGSLVILVLSLKAVGGWDQVLEACRVTPVNEYGDSMINLIRSNRDANFPWLGVFIGSSVIGFWYWCTDQHIVQRVLGQRKGEDNDVVMKRARRGTIAAGYFKILPVFMFLIPGMVAAALAAKGEFDMSNTDAAFAVMVKDVLPAGVKGIVTIGFICALVASLAAFFNSCATLFTEDFYKPMFKNKSEATYVMVGRIATVVVVILGMAWIPVMMSLGSLYDYLQGIQSLLAPAMVAVFALGIFSKKITPKAGETAMIVGFLIGMIRLLTNILTNTGKDVMTGWFWENTTWFWQTNWLIFEIWLLVFLLLLMVVVSCFTPAPTAKQVEAITFTGSYKELIRKSWNKWDVITSLGVVLLCALFYAYFW